MSSIEGMKLKDFIKNAIIDIDKALEEASNETKHSYLFSNGTSQDGKGNINFELMVYSEKNSNGDTGGEIKVYGIGGFLSKIGFSNKNYTTSKINFTVSRKSSKLKRF